MTPDDVRDVARKAYKLGFTPIPPYEDGTKRPIVSWKQYQSEQPSIETMRHWYANGHTRHGIGILTGGRLECLEFEDMGIYQLYRDTAEAGGLGDVIDRIEAGYMETTPGGGVHWLYFCDEIEGNQKLARRPANGKLREHWERDVQVLIETRGDGGYIIIAPSHGDVHETGKPYTLVSGGLDTIIEITPDERQELFLLAQAFDEMPKQAFVSSTIINESTPDGKRPGDIFNETGPAWSEILQPHGWQFVYQSGETEFWRRPGKNIGWSATINGPGVGPDRLYVFSTETLFPDAERSYSKWQAYAVLNHECDFQAAARALADDGYGADNEPAYLVRKARKSGGETGSESPEQLNLTDVGNAHRFVSRHKGRIQYVHAWKKWLVWDGRRWRQDDSGEIYRLALEAIRDMYAAAADIEDNKERKQLASHAIKSESKQRIESMIALAENLVPARPDDLDTDPMLFNVLNGTIDLRTGEMRDHNPDDLITKLSEVRYDLKAECPTFKAFLSDVLDDDPELQTFVQRLAGYSLSADTREQILTFAWGNGQNGKTTLLNTLLALLGEYGMQTPTDTLLIRRTDGIPNDIARLRGARLVAATEVEENRRLSEALVKQLTGGDRISARFMRGEWFDFTPTFKIMLATNHKPVIHGTDHAIWRRIRLIPFTVTIPNEKKDPNLSKKLKRELPGILNWAIAGCLDWLKEGLPMPQRVEQATSAYRSEMDVLSDWFQDRCVIESNAECYSGDLYQSYKTWCEATGEKPKSQKWLSMRLGERGFQSTKGSKGKRKWLGIDVMSHDDYRQSTQLVRHSIN
jgi:putative DNA primase/helicase